MLHIYFNNSYEFLNSVYDWGIRLSNSLGIETTIFMIFLEVLVATVVILTVKFVIDTIWKIIDLCKEIHTEAMERYHTMKRQLKQATKKSQ